MTIELTITESDPQFFAALSNPEEFIPHLGQAMQNIMDKFMEKASVYAPTSEANQPGRFSLISHKPMGFYERGRGWWYPIMQHHTLGFGSGVGHVLPSLKAIQTKSITALRAVGIEGVVGYKLQETSEQMGERWSADVHDLANEVIGILKNSASYSGFVQGLVQTKLHAARDWQTVIQTWESDEMQQVVNEETIRAIDIYYNVATA